MFILTIEGAETEGAYSVTADNGEQVLYLFEDEDDAIRYALLLEDQDYPEMHVIEVDGKVVIKTCELHDYRYSVITKNDIVIPPVENDNISWGQFEYKTPKLENSNMVQFFGGKDNTIDELISKVLNWQ